MLAQAEAELPNECCGLLAGRIVGDDEGRVEERYPLFNKLASPVEFFADGPDLFGAHQEMRRRGIDVLAVYHSHPSSDPIPSRKDLERNWLEVLCVIVSLTARPPLVRAWWLGESDYQEADWTMDAGEAPFSP
jgi:proteasome lid subunit RPN8/RPN11